MWHVSSRRGLATLRTAIHLLHTYITVERCRHERHAARRDQYRQRPAHWPLPRIEALVTGATCPLQLSVCHACRLNKRRNVYRNGYFYQRTRNVQNS